MKKVLFVFFSLIAAIANCQSPLSYNGKVISNSNKPYSITPIAPYIIKQPTNTSVNLNSNTFLTIIASGTNLSYQWQISSNNISFSNLTNTGIYSGVTTQTLNITGATLLIDGYYYRCVITGIKAPPATSNSVVVTVLPPSGYIAYYDGTIRWSDSTLVDKVGVYGNAKIYNVDFDTNFVKEGIPYSSNAYIKLPTALKNQYTNPLDTLFVKKNLYAQNFYQDVDYRNLIYSRVNANVLNSDSTQAKYSRVNRIAFYTTNTDSLNRASYFIVPKIASTGVYWVDSINGNNAFAGTFAAPFKTISKAVSVVATNDTVYVKSGMYPEAAAMNLTGSKNLTFIGTGYVTVTSASATNIVLQTNGTSDWHHFNFNGRATTTNMNQTAAGSTIKQRYCRFVAIKTYSAYNEGNNYYYDCCQPEYAAINLWERGSGITCWFERCYITQVYFSTTYNPTIKYCRHYSNSATLTCQNFIFAGSSQPTYTDIIGCEWTARQHGISDNSFVSIAGTDIITCSLSSPKTWRIRKCKFKALYGTGSTGNNAIYCTHSCSKILIDSCNFDGDSITRIAGGVTGIGSQSQLSMEISNSFFRSYTKISSTGIILGSNRTGQTRIPVKIHDNYFYNNDTTQLTISVGGEATDTNRFITRIYNNYMEGSLIRYPSTTTGTHAILSNCADTMLIHHNNIRGFAIGVVMKGYLNRSIYCAMYNNLLFNNRVQTYERRANGIYIYNNTMYQDTRISQLNTSYAIETDNQFTYGCPNLNIVNNIIYQLNPQANATIFGFDTIWTNLVWKNNLIHWNKAITNNFVRNTGTGYVRTLAQTQSIGWIGSVDTNSIVINSNNLVSTDARITGTGFTLASPFNIAFSSTNVPTWNVCTWNLNKLLPCFVLPTVSQVVPWNMGVYKQ